MTTAINFSIVKSGTVKGMQEYFAETPAKKLLATISPRLQSSGTYSKRFLSVCHIDGKTDIADGIEDASEIIATKHFN